MCLGFGCSFLCSHLEVGFFGRWAGFRQTRRCFKLMMSTARLSFEKWQCVWSWPFEMHPGEEEFESRGARARVSSGRHEVLLQIIDENLQYGFVMVGVGWLVGWFCLVACGVCCCCSFGFLAFFLMAFYFFTPLTSLPKRIIINALLQRHKLWLKIIIRDTDSPAVPQMTLAQNWKATCCH